MQRSYLLFLNNIEQTNKDFLQKKKKGKKSKHKSMQRICY